jgi:hypothetical protein
MLMPNRSLSTEVDRVVGGIEHDGPSDPPPRHDRPERRP